MTLSASSGRRYAGASAVHRQAERRQRLLDAGLAIIGTEGFQAATVRAVCQEARLTERYFYESFASREALLLAVYQKSAAGLSLRLSEAVQAMSQEEPAMIVRAAAASALSWLKDDPRQARILYFEMLGSSETLRHVFLASTKNFADLILTLLSPVLEKPPPKGYKPEVLAAAIVGAFNHLILWWAWSDYEKPLEEMTEDCSNVFLAILAPVMKRPETSKAKRQGKKSGRGGK